MGRARCMNGENQSRITVSLDKATYDSLMIYLSKNGIRLSEFARQAVREKLIRESPYRDPDKPL